MKERNTALTGGNQMIVEIVRRSGSQLLDIKAVRRARKDWTKAKTLGEMEEQLRSCKKPQKYFQKDKLEIY